MSNAPRKWSLEGFVEHFDFFHHKMLDHKFVWMLGAGASLASGIPLGSELVDRWLAELHLRENKAETPIDKWATADNLDIIGFKYEDRVCFYPKVYERRFRDYPDEGYAYLESVMADADPSPGYSILAAALAGKTPDSPPRHNAVVTTNFDNLVADALAIYTDTFPFVCGHESLTPFVRVAMRRPLVCKIHRDLLLAPQNDPRSLRRLHDAWGIALRALFEHYTPLFIGYGGNDDTLMDLLESLQPGDIKGQLIWCYYERTEPSERIVNVVADHQGILVPVPDFDLLMVLLGEKMGIGLLDQDIGVRSRARTDRYRKRIRKLDTVKHPEVTKALAKTYERSGGWWVWDQKAESEEDLKRREIVYRQGIQHCPESAPLHFNFALFLAYKCYENEEAEQFFRMAIQLDPKNTHILTDFAIFLTDVRGAHDEAEALFQQVIEIDSKDTNYICNYAIFLQNIRRTYEKAESLYQRALELEPGSARVTSAFADFLTDVRGKHDEAEHLYRRALKLDPKNATNIGNFAVLMSDVRGDKDEAERLYRQAIDLDPTDARSTGNLASFMSDVRGEHDEAETLYKLALELDPHDGLNTGNFAIFMSDVRGDIDEADRLHRRTIELDPKDADVACNYASFLLGQGRFHEANAHLSDAKSLHDGRPHQVATEIALNSSILAAIQNEDEVPSLKELLESLSVKFRRSHWNFDNVIARAQPHVSRTLHGLFVTCAEAILDEKRVPAALEALEKHLNKKSRKRSKQSTAGTTTRKKTTKKKTRTTQRSSKNGKRKSSP